MLRQLWKKTFNKAFKELLIKSDLHAKSNGQKKIKKRRSHVMQTHHKSLVSGRKVLQSVGKSAVYWILSTAGFSSALTAIFVVSLLSFASPPKRKSEDKDVNVRKQTSCKSTDSAHYRRTFLCLSKSFTASPRSLFFTKSYSKNKENGTVFPTCGSPACCSTIIGFTVPNFHKARDVWISTHFL